MPDIPLVKVKPSEIDNPLELTRMTGRPHSSPFGILYGGYAVLFGICVHVLYSRRGPGRVLNLPRLITALLLFSMSTVHIRIDLSRGLTAFIEIAPRMAQPNIMLRSGYGVTSSNRPYNLRIISSPTVWFGSCDHVVRREHLQLHKN
ncbi:hypothetical protein C8R47DRAFT_1159644 [Mycena vitilis]|nr:hypothetical protein C8R47DRAFT_1159644 [Mycena vitilis]